MAEIALEGMEFYAYHGCFKEEKIIGTKFKVDLKVRADLENSELSDRLDDTMDYQVLYNIVSEQMEIRADLLEHLCRRIIDAIISRFPHINHVIVTVAKLNPPLGGKLKNVSLSLEHYGKS